MTPIYPLLPYLILLATCAPGFHLLPPTYNYSRPWLAPPGEPPLVTRSHAHSGHCPLTLAEPAPNWGLQSLHAHTKYTAGVQLCMGVGRHASKVTNWCSLCPCRSHTSTTMKPRGCTPSNPAMKGKHPFVHPHVYILVQGAH